MTIQGILSKLANALKRYNDDNDDDMHNHEEHPIPFRELCAWHDELMHHWHHDVFHQNIQKQLTRFRCSELDFSIVASEADLLRALLVVSRLLLDEFYATETEDDNKTELIRIIQQSSLLLNLLSEIHSFSYTEDCDIPSEYPDLQTWLDQQTEYEAIYGRDEVSTRNVISFDREALVLEECQLLQMANTPTPTELNLVSNSEPLHAQMKATAPLPHQTNDRVDVESVAVRMEDNGILRPCDTNQPWFAALTASSEMKYKHPVLSISSVVILYSSADPSKQSMTNVELNAPNGHEWWERCSLTIQKLERIHNLQQEVEQHWPKEQINEQVGLALRELVAH